jgi:hypothetical protein
MGDVFSSLLGGYSKSLGDDAAKLAQPTIDAATKSLLKQAIPYLAITILSFAVIVAIIVRKKR